MEQHNHGDKIHATPEWLSLFFKGNFFQIRGLEHQLKENVGDVSLMIHNYKSHGLLSNKECSITINYERGEEFIEKYKHLEKELVDKHITPHFHKINARPIEGNGLVVLEYSSFDEVITALNRGNIEKGEWLIHTDEYGVRELIQPIEEALS